MSFLNKITAKFKQKDKGIYTSGNPYKHGGHLWCNGVYYQPRDVAALVMYSEYAKQRIKDLTTDNVSDDVKENICREYAEDLLEEFQQIERFEGKITLDDVADILQICE